MKAHSPSHQHADKKTVFQFLPGPVKIKDGLFMGDQIAARDIEFIISNKVTHVINTVSKQIPNLWQRFGIHYLSVNWTEKQQNIFDKKNNSVNTIYHFIEEAMEQGQSCLIHSVNGKSRACAVTISYMIRKYAWGLNKCLEFVSSKKENLEIRNNYMTQLQELQQRMSQIYSLTSEWGKIKNEEQLVLINTYANSKLAIPEKNQKREVKGERNAKRRVNFAQKPVVIKQSAQTNTRAIMMKQTTKTPTKNSVKSILKGDFEPEVKKQKTIDDFQEVQIVDSHKKPRGNVINNINGNIVHVTVNNFITSDKKQEQSSKNTANTRPYSSDQKDRQKQKKPLANKKILGYDSNPIGSFKSPYDYKLANRAGSNTKFPKKKQQKEIKPGSSAYQRPQSAKNRPGISQNINNKLRDQLIVTNSNSSNSVVTNSIGKKRYPSNPREQLYKRR